MNNKNAFDLDRERLASTDEHGHRVYLHPEDVHGKWKNRRSVVYWGLIAFYLMFPWIYVNGKPAILVDIAHREFTLLGTTFHGVEPILLFLAVASALFFIAFLTSLFGRVWCGWACPQTVFIQSLFLKLETFFEGNARTRRKADQTAMTFSKLGRRILKWASFTVVSLHIAHTFIGYFVGPRELFHITTQNPSEHLTLFIATMLVTFILLLDFGWFREQFCIIACPYGKMQSVMMDENSLVVMYDAKRGEPRKGETAGLQGDCVNCYACVRVCPTGIDIRRGTQLECIACTQCIDACDDIMARVKKPQGLIRYSSENEIRGAVRSLFTARSGIYVGISLFFISSFGYFLNASTRPEMIFLRDKTPYQTIDDGRTVVNHFTLRLTHQGGEEYLAKLRIEDLTLRSSVDVVVPMQKIHLDAPLKSTVVFFKFPPAVLLEGRRKLRVELMDDRTQDILATKEVTLVGPTTLDQ